MVRTRFAPSPTGYLHIGGARTALFSWLYARHHGGSFVLRIEDTDLERSTPEAVAAILEGMQWLGLDYDEGPFYQTRRFDRYREVIGELLEAGHAYHCYCSREELDAMRTEQMANKQTPRYDGRCRHRSAPREGVTPVVRFRNPTDGVVAFDDMILGPIQVANSELDDLIIARADGSPTYNFTVVVDDLDMQISHVIRGNDHVNNTPRQINIMRALGRTPPRYAHVPMILGPDGAKLSKRHGAASVLEYREAGFLAEALRNYLVRLGWSRGDQEVFSVAEMQALFDVVDVNKAPSAINPGKLAWLNQYYMRAMSPAGLADAVRPFLAAAGAEAPFARLDEIVAVQVERAQTLVELADVCRFFYIDPDTFDAKAANKAFKPAAVPPLQAIRARFAELENWGRAAIHDALQAVVAELGIGFGKLGMPLRLAATGGQASPDLDLTLDLIGREPTLRRIDKALQVIGAAEDA